mmetsp:Transcript_4487/g.7432  ORF Transcript_4487/g.7432 Transcript_4487/m.7432 type:complete len:333 (-) Transcript_4487:322-1320(-)
MAAGEIASRRRRLRAARQREGGRVRRRYASNRVRCRRARWRQANFKVEKFVLVHAERVLPRGEAPSGDGAGVVGERGRHALANRGELAGEARHLTIVQTEQVVKDLHLPVGSDARADADCRDRQLLREQLGHGRGDHLQHDCEAAGRLEGLRVGQEPARFLGGATLHAVPAELRVRLRREADVPHHRDARAHEGLDLGQHAHPALKLHHVGAPLLDEAHAVTGRLFRGEIAPKRHVRHHQRALGAARRRRRVVDHLLHGDRGRVLVAEDDHAEGVADEDDVDAGAIGRLRAWVVVGRHHADRLLALVLELQLVEAHLHLLGGRPWGRVARRL